MKHEELAAVQKKVDELRAVLLFGKKALPFLEDIFAFVHDVIPVMGELKVSVEATSDKFPKASKQLDKVTHATEMASTEILNTLETMFAKLEEMMVHDSQIQQRSELLAETSRDIEAGFNALDAGLTGQGQMTRMRNAWEKHRASLSLPEERSLAALRSLQGNCTDIMMALQVQDITAQQIASVNRLMQSVDESLNKLMKHFAEVPASAIAEGYHHAHLDIPFDDAADFFGSQDRQKAADALVEGVQSNNKQYNEP